MSQVFSEETPRNLLSRIPRRAGREVSDRLRTVEEGPALRFEEKVSRLRSEHDLAHGHAKALIREYDLRRAARKPLQPHVRKGERPAGSACGPFRSRCGAVCQSSPLRMESRRSISR
ncbi:protein of unknown function [Streptomyces sp. Ncost-T10-10d]|nr:protein of unknown function [Streptomyces sp. Ncost-T10-10d]